MGYYRSRHRAAGDFQLELDPATPRRVLRYLDLATYGFAHLLITGVHVPDGAVSPSSFPTHARFAGLIRRAPTGPASKRTPFTVAGPSIAALLGDEDGKGSVPTAAVAQTKAFYNGTSASWLYDHLLVSQSNGITAGSIPSASTPTRQATFDAGTSRREILDTICDIFGREWRLNADGTLDAGTAANLFRSGKVIAGPRMGGRSAALTGVDADITVDPDIEDTSSGIRVNPSTAANTGSATASPWPYVDWAGGGLDLVRYISSSEAADATTAAAIAAAQQGRFDQVDQAVKVTTAHHDLHKIIDAGDWIYLRDPDQRLADITTPVPHRGEVVPAALIRALGLREPFRAGQGAALRWWDGSAFRILDLTRYVMPADGDAEIEVGALPRTLSRAA